MPSTDRKLELKAKTSVAQITSQAAVYAKGLMVLHSTQWATVPSLSKLQDHTHTHHTQFNSYIPVTIPKLRPLPDNTQQSPETDICAPGGIQTHNHGKQAATDLPQTTQPLGSASLIVTEQISSHAKQEAKL
jgi:hypothetical protein